MGKRDGQDDQRTELECDNNERDRAHGAHSENRSPDHAAEAIDSMNVMHGHGVETTCVGGDFPSDAQVREQLSMQRRELVESFLREHGYSDVNAKRRCGLFKTKYALHSAVKENDRDVVRGLLNSGADPRLKNSKGQTPLQLAQKSDRGGSHADVIACLM